ncbi:MAG: LptF/LptG family permease [Betaproteobacteria bacterium]|nr:MAG: LptF/LptG family permease [Betaproteobacteria bacterium]
MTKTLAGYLRRRVAARTLTLIALLTALMQVLELLDKTTDVLDRGLGIKGLAYYALLRIPAEIVLALPLAALLGTMWAFHDLARNHEMIAVRTAGVSLRQIVTYLLPVPLAVALTHFVLSQAVMPDAEAALQSWWVATAPPEEAPQPSWIRTSAGPISYLAASPDGRRLTGVKIYQRGENKLLAARISARTAEWQHGAWQLHDVEQLRVTDRKTQPAKEPTYVWKTNLRPDDVQRAEIARPSLSSAMLMDVIGGERAASRPISYYQTALYRSFVAPLMPFVMLLLALPAARGLPRHLEGGAALVLALVLGLAYLLCDGLMAALGTSGQVPAAGAALAAPALFSAVGLLQLHFSEGR